MPKPNISKDFTVQDIRRLRDYNSMRHASMSLEEIISEGKRAMEIFLVSVGKKEKIA